MKSSRCFSKTLQLAESQAIEGDSTLLDGMHSMIGEVLRECPQKIDWVCANKMRRILQTKNEVETIIFNREKNLKG